MLGFSPWSSEGVSNCRAQVAHLSSYREQVRYPAATLGRSLLPPSSSSVEQKDTSCFFHHVLSKRLHDLSEFMIFPLFIPVVPVIYPWQVKRFCSPLSLQTIQALTAEYFYLSHLSSAVMWGGCAGLHMQWAAQECQGCLLTSRMGRIGARVVPRCLGSSAATHPLLKKTAEWQ